MTGNDQRFISARLDPDEVNLREYWDLLSARRRVVFGTLVAVVLLTFGANLAMPSWYLGETTLQIESDVPKVLDFNDLLQVDATTDAFYQTQYRLIESRSLAARVIESEGLLDNPEFMGRDGSSVVMDGIRWVVSTPGRALRALRGGSAPDGDAVGTAPSVPAPAIDAFRSRLSVEPVRNTRLVRITWGSADPELSARITNAVAREYIDMNLEAKYETTAQASEFLAAQIERLEDDIAAGESELQSYGVERNILSSDERQDTVTQTLNSLSAEVTRAQTERVQRQTYYEQLRNANRSSIPEVIGNNLIVNLKSDLADLQQRYGELRRQFTDEMPDVQRVLAQLEDTQAQIDAEEQRIYNGLVDNAENEFRAAQDREDQVEAMFNEQRTLAGTLNRDLITYRNMQTEIDNNKQLLDTLRERQSETGVSARLQGMAASNIRVVDPATVPLRPDSPKIALNLALAVILGLMLGVGVAFFQAYIDNTLKSAEDVERHLSLPSLGEIPSIRSLKNGSAYSYSGYTEDLDKDANPELVSLEHPRSALAEAYRSLRTAVLLSRPGGHPKTILVTSSVPGEGKTTSALNLAVAFAQAGKKTLLVDADLRRPRLANLLGLDQDRGLVHFLTGSRTELKELVQKTQVKGLWALPCGPRPPNPAELLSGDQTERLMSVFRNSFDVVVIDSPPVMAVTDPLVLLPFTDGVVFVVHGNKTPYPLAQRASRKIRDVQGTILGVALNNVEPERGGYYYYGQRYQQPQDPGSSVASKDALTAAAPRTVEDPGSTRANA